MDTEGIMILATTSWVVGIVIVVLNVILFFKIWGMTNDTKEIKETLQEWFDIEHPLIEEADPKDKTSTS